MCQRLGESCRNCVYMLNIEPLRPLRVDSVIFTVLNFVALFAPDWSIFTYTLIHVAISGSAYCDQVVCIK